MLCLLLLELNCLHSSPPVRMLVQMTVLVQLTELVQHDLIVQLPMRLLQLCHSPMLVTWPHAALPSHCYAPLPIALRPSASSHLRETQSQSVT